MKSPADLCFRGHTSWIIPLVLLVLTILLFELTPWDTWIQDHFYTPGEGWLLKLDKHHGFGLVYYTGPKWLLGQLGFVLGAIIVWIAIRKRRLAWGLLYVVITMISIPCLVANIKSDCSVPYPSRLVRYGGKEQPRNLYQAFFEPIPAGSKRYHGWPAGHASGGFAPIGAAFVPERKKYRWLAFGGVTALGFFMGICHTMDGNHFFSHNLVSYFLAWMVAAFLYLLFDKIKKHVERILASRASKE